MPSVNIFKSVAWSVENLEEVLLFHTKEELEGLKITISPSY